MISKVRQDVTLDRVQTRYLNATATADLCEIPRGPDSQGNQFVDMRYDCMFRLCRERRVGVPEKLEVSLKQLQRAAIAIALYDDVVERRLMVKPGMSGLWQVSGRSQLSPEDSIRLDLYYVENWSFTQDLQILFRTIKAGVAPGRTAH